MTSPTSAPIRAARAAVAAVRTHPVAGAALAGAALLVAGFLVLVGLDLFIVVGLLAVVAAGALLLDRLGRRAIAPDGVRARGGLAVGAAGLSALLTFGLIQLVPYGRDHSNLPVTGEPQWANPQTRDLMVNACFACHSNEVDYPAYASVAPLSWAVQRHVDEGREAVNYSEFDSDPGEADNTVEVIEEGEMPPPFFTRFGRHPEAKLSNPELEALIAGLRATPGMSEDGGGESSDGD